MGEKNGIYQAVLYAVSDLYSQRDKSSGKAALARLRASIGKKDISDIADLLFKYLPEEFLGKGERLSHGEEAVLTALQLYALHQQGKEDIVCESDGKYYNAGSSLRMLRDKENYESVDRRFNAMITTDTFSEFIVHLRHMIKLLRSSKLLVEVNYGRLAEDLYRFQSKMDGKERIRLNWSREYYKLMKEGEENE